MTLSAVIIAKNEEDMIADCIDSLGFCDEIVVIDNQSTDRTAEIAKSMGAKIFTDTGKDFAKRRNLGMEKAKGKWVLYVDADERISKELAKEMKTVIQDSHYVAYSLPRRDFRYGGVRWEYLGRFTRLFEKKHFKRWYGELHESSEVDGEIGELSEEMQHFTHRDLSQMLAKTITWSDTEAKLRYESNHPLMSWWRFIRVMMTAFFASYIKEKGYKMGTAGLIEAIYQSYSMFITYARLWEMQQDKLVGSR